MTEKKEVKKVEETAVATVNSEAIAKLREGSGENNGGDKIFLKIYQPDNTKEKTKMPDGREIDALCAPRWKITSNVDGEYQTSSVDSFKGVILKMMWQVENKGKWDQVTNTYISNNAPFFRSPLMSSSIFFGTKMVNIKLLETNEVLSMTYQELKNKFGDNFTLTGWTFVLVDGEIVRLKLNGSSRSAMFDYPKLFKNNDSMSAHVTLFSAEYVDKPQPHNVAKFELTSDPVDIDEVVAFQSMINDMYDNAATKMAEAFGGEVIDKPIDTGEITIDGPTFN